MPTNQRSNSVSSNNIKIQDVPGFIPTITSTSNGDFADSLKVNFSIPSINFGGRPESYRVVSNPGNIVSTGKSSPVEVRGLTPGTNYTFTASADTRFGVNIGVSSPSIAKTPTGSIEPIASLIFPGGVPNAGLLNIPQNYRDLILVVTGRRTDSTSLGNLCITPSNNQSQAFSTATIQSDGTTLSSQRATSQDTWIAGLLPAATATAGVQGVVVMHIFNYTSSNFKTAISFSASDLNGSGHFSTRMHLSRNTIPVTAIDVSTFNGSQFFTAGTTAFLYGVKSE
jgi:hypothetical protein